MSRPKGCLGDAAAAGKALAQKILKANNESRLWERALHSKDDGVMLKALIDLTDRAYGKPKASLEHSGAEGKPPVAFKIILGSADGSGS